MKKLLVIFAHPDDESFGPCAGTLAKYAQEGVAIHYLCATRGEAGIVDEQLLTDYPGIASLRTHEVTQAAKVLGFADLQFLPYRDSGMAGAPENAHPNSLVSAPLDDVAHAISDHIRSVQPDVIITHDHYGWYGHPDHIKCYQAVLLAYQLLYGFIPAAATGVEWYLPHLYVSTFPKWLVKLTAQTMSLFGHDPRRYGQNGDIDLLQIASWKVPTTARINVRQYLGIKSRAAACHASQVSLTSSSNPIMQFLVQYSARSELFHRLFPRPVGSVITDLFPDLPTEPMKSRGSRVPIQPFEISKRSNA